MLNVLVGILLGFLSGLGVGGGSLLLLWLTLVTGTDAATARAINLLFFLPAAVISCCFRWKQGSLQVGKLLPAILGGCVGSIMGIRISGSLHTEILRQGFGLLLMITGFRELCYRPKKKTD